MRGPPAGSSLHGRQVDPDTRDMLKARGEARGEARGGANGGANGGKSMCGALFCGALIWGDSLHARVQGNLIAQASTSSQ